MIYTYMEYFYEIEFIRDTNARLRRESKDRRPATLSPNAQQFRQKIRNLGALDLTDEKIINKIPEIFWKSAVIFNLHLFSEDVDYINNKICPNPIFNMTRNPHGHDLLTKSNIIVFFENILDDETAPNGIKKVMAAKSQHDYNLRLSVPETERDVRISDYLKLRRPLIELWFEMVNLTH